MPTGRRLGSMPQPSPGAPEGLRIQYKVEAVKSGTRNGIVWMAEEGVCWLRDPDREVRPAPGGRTSIGQAPGGPALTECLPQHSHLSMAQRRQQCTFSVGNWGKEDAKGESLSCERMFYVQAVITNFHTNSIYVLFSYPSWKQSGEFIQRLGDLFQLQIFVSLLAKQIINRNCHKVP